MLRAAGIRAVDRLEIFKDDAGQLIVPHLHKCMRGTDDSGNVASSSFFILRPILMTDRPPVEHPLHPPSDDPEGLLRHDILFEPEMDRDDR